MSQCLCAQVKLLKEMVWPTELGWADLNPIKYLWEYKELFAKMAQRQFMTLVMPVWLAGIESPQ